VPDNSPKYALITGASEGIGLELARLMASEGWNLILVARREAILREISTELFRRHSVICEAIAADLAIPASPERIHHITQAKGLKIDALINNAGFGYYGFFQEQNIDRLAAMVEVNITALMRLTRLFLPDMLARGSGMIMNIASTASYQPVPLSGVYAATKAFVLSWSLALAEELKGTGVTVTTVCPGVTRTGFQKAAGADYLERARGRVMTAEEVAQIGYRAMMKGKRLVVAGLHNKMMAQGNRLASHALAAKVAKMVMEGNLGL
jgi:hypothetical protein